MAFSIIISTRNSFIDKQGSIHLTLSSIAKQKIEDDFEIIIVNNNSSDKTDKYLRNEIPSQIKKNIKIYFCEEIGNRSKSRNIGIKKSKYDKLVLLDDDIIFFNENTLQQAVTMTPANAFSCGVKRYWMKRFWNENEILNIINNQKYKKLKQLCFLPKGISRETGFRDLQEYSFIAHFGVVTKTILKEVGCFDEFNFPSRREDVQLMYKLLMKKIPFVCLFDYCSGIHLTHTMITANDNPFERLEYHQLFKNYEKQNGYNFNVHRLFGIDEGKKLKILEPIGDQN